MPLVSVIIPNYNHAPYLKQRIDSVLEQTFQDFEVIILDDCSTDNSKEIIESYRSHPKVVLIEYNTINSGSTFKQWKKGIDLAQGEYIWIAESDDWAEKEFLKEMINEIRNFKDVGISYCKSIPVDKDNLIIGNLDEFYNKLDSIRWNKNYTNFGNLEVENYFIHLCEIVNASSTIIKRELFERITIRTDFRYAGDWMAYIMLLRFTNIMYISKNMNYHRSHANNVRSKINQFQSVYEVTLVLHYITSNYNPILKNVLKRSIIIFKENIYALKKNWLLMSLNNYILFVKVNFILIKILLRIFTIQKTEKINKLNKV